jgi:ankyrin repeat protein
MDIDKVRELIAAGANVNVRNKYDATPLYMAVGTMQAEVVNFLLTAKADVNAAPRLGLTPLVVAVGNGDVKTVKLLLAAGADVELPLGEFPTSRYKLPFVPNKPTPSSNVRVHLAPLWVATIYGHTEIVKMLLDSGANVNVADRDRISAIHIATGYNRRDIVKMLLAHHADPNMVSPAYYTPLSHAVSNNNIEIVKLLLAAKADPNAYGSRGTPLFCALMDSRPGIAKVLRAAGADLSKPAPSSLRRAAGSGREDVVKLMLKAKVTPNPIRRGGIDSPLHAACRGGHISMVRLLLKAGADVNAIVNSMKGNMTPMSIAKSNGSTAIAELLQKHGGKE